MHRSSIPTLGEAEFTGIVERGLDDGAGGFVCMLRARAV